MTVTGKVIEEQKNYFLIDTLQGQVMATTSGGLKKLRTRVCTGDIVEVNIIGTGPLRGVITSIHERTAFIKRPALANCSHLLCICSYKEPPLNLESLDRLIFCAQVNNLQPCVVFNKSDLLGAEDTLRMQEIADAYKAIGFPIFTTSARTREGIDGITGLCAGRTAAFAGLSGVGKSTLLAAIFPDVEFRIGALSAASSRGTHTTTSVTLLPLPNGGYIADTPGLAYIDLPQVPQEDVALYFPELERCVGKCRFNNCIHENEPGCFVIEKINEGAIARWRHTHYLKIYYEMMEKRKQYR